MVCLGYVTCRLKSRVGNKDGQAGATAKQGQQPVQVCGGKIMEGFIVPAGFKKGVQAPRF
jgi:hypothetical protein